MNDGTFKKIKAINLKKIDVEICNLKNSVSINGMIGEITSPLTDGRYEVKLSNKQLKKIKPPNLLIILKEETQFSPRSFDKLDEVKRRERAWFRNYESDPSKPAIMVPFDTIECISIENNFIKYLQNKTPKTQ